VTQITVLDLDDAAAVERLWEAVRRQSSCRRRKPRLYRAIVRSLDQAISEGRVTTIEADLVRLELRSELHPAAVLSGHWRVLVPNRPALGSFLRKAASSVE
jgi:hypothetical protein